MGIATRLVEEAGRDGGLQQDRELCVEKNNLQFWIYDQITNHMFVRGCKCVFAGRVHVLQDVLRLLSAVPVQAGSREDVLYIMDMWYASAATLQV